MIVVCGGGIAGVAFAISYVVNGGKEEVVILEKGKDVQSRAGEYSHSLIVRDDMKGIDALVELGVFDELKTLTTASHGFFIARAGNPIRLAIATDWFGASRGLRLLRFDLWRTLLKRAQELNIPIRWGHCAAGYAEDGVHVDSPKGAILLPASLVIVADGARSVVRTATTNEGLCFLHTVIVGASLEGSLPEPCRNRHGQVVGNGCGVFTAQETPEKILVSLSFPSDLEVDRKADEAWINSKVLSYIDQFPTLKPQILAVLKSPDMWVVNCRDRLPLKGSKPLIFVGDASHAVSPFAGAGANMALIDGNILGKLVAAHADSKSSYETIQSELEKLTFKKWTKVVMQQRSTITLCHSTTLWHRGVKSVVMTGLPLMISPDYKLVRRLVFFSLVIGMVAAAARQVGLFS